LDGVVGPGVVAKSLLGIDIGTSRSKVPPLTLVCRRMFAFSMQITHVHNGEPWNWEAEFRL